MTEDDLKAIEARASAAVITIGNNRYTLVARIICREDIPALIAEVRRLREEIEDMQEMHAMAGEP